MTMGVTDTSDADFHWSGCDIRFLVGGHWQELDTLLHEKEKKREREEREFVYVLYILYLRR